MTNTRIGDLMRAGALTMGDGYRTKRSEHGMPGFRIMRVADVLDGRICLTGTDYVSRDFARQIGPKLSHAGDVVLTTKGTVGRVSRVPEGLEQTVYSPQVCYFRIQDRETLDPRYLELWLRSDEFKRQASDRANNTDMAAYINLADVRSLELHLPSISEQRAIAEVLGALDDKIAANTDTTSTAMELAHSYFVMAARRAEHEAPLSELMTLEYGKALSAGSRVPGDVAVYGSGGIVGNHNVALIDRPGVVVGRKGTAGAVHWADGPHFPIDTTYFVVPASDTMPLTYCYFALGSARLSEMNSDSAVPGLNRNEAHAAPVRLPNDVDLQRFDLAVSPLFDHAAQLRAETRTLSTTRDALLPLLMSGKLRVKDAERVVEEAI